MNITIKQHTTELVISCSDPRIINRLRTMLLNWVQLEAEKEYLTTYDVRTEQPQAVPPLGLAKAPAPQARLGSRDICPDCGHPVIMHPEDNGKRVCPEPANASLIVRKGPQPPNPHLRDGDNF